MEARGEVRRLADAFGEGEVERASLQLQSAVESCHSTLQNLDGFLRDNQQLSKLVQELPTKVSYPVMVPFGKAAFFPGKLVHTNEYLVLLGEGYYAEFSAVKTLEILARRGKLLSSKISAVKSQLANLDVESRFFNETFAEAAAGCVEIREEFVETLSSEQEPSKEAKSDSVSKINVPQRKMVAPNDDDNEHERLMARLDEIAAAEAEAERKTATSSHNNMRNEAHERANAEDGGDELAKLGESDEFCPKLISPGDLVKFEQWRRCNSRKGSTSKEQSTLPAAGEDVEEHEDAHNVLHHVSSMLGTEGEDVAKSSMADKAFTGSVIERSGQFTVENSQEVARQHQRRPVSKFKQRQADK